MSIRKLKKLNKQKRKLLCPSNNINKKMMMMKITVMVAMMKND